MHNYRNTYMLYKYYINYIMYTDYNNICYLVSKFTDYFEDDTNKTMSVQNIFLYKYPKVKKRKNEEEICKTTSKLIWS